MSDSLNPSSNGKDAFDELRSLLVGPEKVEIERLQQKLQDSRLDADLISQVLPQAIRKAIVNSVHSITKTRHRKTPIVHLLIFGVLSLVVWWLVFQLPGNIRWGRYLQHLEKKPGIVVTKTGKRNGKFQISGLRDPLAADPLVLLKENGIEPAVVESNWEAYQSLTPEFIAARAAKLLNLPAGVELRFENGVLIATGRAPHSWIQESKRLISVMAGVQELNVDRLEDIEMQELQQGKQKIEQTSLLFVERTADLIRGQESAIEKLVEEIMRLNNIAKGAGINMNVAVVGHADEEATEDQNIHLSRLRSQNILYAIASSGFDMDNLSIIASGSISTIFKPRSVTFQIAYKETH